MNSRDEPTHEQKLAMVRGGPVHGWGYKFKAPPVCTANWSPVDWVRYIDACRGWYRAPN